MSPFQRLPYPGLRAFSRDESDLFFGREGCIDAMVDRLAATRFLAVLGPSGSGKSSLVRTGLLEALDLGFHPQAGSNWRVADLHPGGQPLRKLAAALLEAKTDTRAEDYDINSLVAFLRRGPRSIVEWASKGNLPQGSNLLILVDQFEEIFRYGDYAQREEAEAFVGLLLESASSTAAIHAVITMRSEYLGACASMPELAERISAGLYLTPRMNREECCEAVEGPAGVLGFRVEPALANRLLNDLGSLAPWEESPEMDLADHLSHQADQLPLMQHVLNRLWMEADRQSGESAVELKLADYERFGGLSGALDAHGQEIMAALGEAKAPLIENVFRSLVSGTSPAVAVRRPCRMAELIEVANGARNDVVAIVEDFRAAGCNFLRTSEESLAGDDVIVDISHESLIRQWTLLRNWVEKEARDAAAWRRVVSAEEHYSQGEGGLLAGLDLHNLMAWWESASPTEIWASRYGNKFAAAQGFIETSRKAEVAQACAEQRRRTRERNLLRTGVAGLAVVLLVVSGLGVTTWLTNTKLSRAKQEAEAQKQKAEAQKQEAEAQKQEAEAQKQEADEARIAAEDARQKADELAHEENEAKKEAVRQRDNARSATRTAEQERNRADSEARKRQVAEQKNDEMANAANEAKREADDAKQEANEARQDAEMMTQDADALVKEKSGPVAYRIAWDAYVSLGDRLRASDHNGARQAFAHSSGLAAHLSSDNADDLYKRLVSDERLGDLDSQAGKFEDAEGWYAREVKTARKIFNIQTTPESLNSLRIATIRRCQTLVKLDAKKQSEANALQKELAGDAEALVKKNPGSAAYRVAWDILTEQGDSLRPTDPIAARQAFARSSELASLLPSDNADDLYKVVFSDERLGDLDSQARKFEDAEVWYAKEVEAARKSYTIISTPDSLRSLRLATIRLNQTLIRLKRQSEIGSFLRNLASSAEALVQQSQSEAALEEAVFVYTDLADAQAHAADPASAQKDLMRAQELAQRLGTGTADATYATYFTFEAIGNSLLNNNAPGDARSAYAQASALLQRYISLRTGSPPQRAASDTRDLYSLYGNLSWACVLSGNFSNAADAARSGLKLNSDAAWIEANLAHALLLSGKQDEAIRHYMKARKGTINGRPILEATREDFDILKKLGLGTPAMDDILKQMAAN